jgi:hypothetical protein
VKSFGKIPLKWKYGDQPIYFITAYLNVCCRRTITIIEMEVPCIHIEMSVRKNECPMSKEGRPHQIPMAKERQSALEKRACKMFTPGV